MIMPVLCSRVLIVGGGGSYLVFLFLVLLFSLIIVPHSPRLDIWACHYQLSKFKWRIGLNLATEALCSPIWHFFHYITKLLRHHLIVTNQNCSIGLFPHTNMKKRLCCTYCLISTYKTSARISYFSACMRSWACAIVTYGKRLCNNSGVKIPREFLIFRSHNVLGMRNNYFL